MSMSTSIVNGYGFEIGASDKQIRDFVLAHKKNIESKNIKEEIKLVESCIANDIENLSGRYDTIACDTTGNEGLYAIVANVITRETGIRFQYEPGCANCNSNAAILFEPMLPWGYNEEEKKLTNKKLDEIVNKYMNEIGNIVTNGWLSVEYYG